MNIEIKEPTHGPVYAQVREQLENLIKSNEIPSGEILPTPAALAQKLSVDRGEIQRAYFELEQSGLVKKDTSKDFLGQPKITYRVA